MKTIQEKASKGPVTLRFYNDPGHGWLAVKVQYLIDLGIADKITNFSYLKGKTAYLEEDVDVGTFVEAAKEAGIEIKMTSGAWTNNNSPIRSYPRFFSHKIIDTIVG